MAKPQKEGIVEKDRREPDGDVEHAISVMENEGPGTHPDHHRTPTTDQSSKHGRPKRTKSKQPDSDKGGK